MKVYRRMPAACTDTAAFEIDGTYYVEVYNSNVDWLPVENLALMAHCVVQTGAGARFLVERVERAALAPTVRSVELEGKRLPQRCFETLALFAFEAGEDTWLLARRVE